jgi:uncharacterized membrane protein YuzA (DUF378 family)
MVNIINPFTDRDISTLHALAWLVAGIGALNWGLVALADFNLVTEFLSSGGADLVYIAIGVAGGLNIIELVTDVEVMGLYEQNGMEATGSFGGDGD